MYVDEKPAWQNVEYTTGFGTDILKIGIDREVQIGELAALNIDIDNIYVKIN